MTAPAASGAMAAVFGCAGPVLLPDEAAFFRDCEPLGFILFARNCESPAQIQRLTNDLRTAVGRDEAPVLMDHEGGRVQRLAPPQWRKVPAAAEFGRLASVDPAAAIEAAALNGQLMALELSALGVDVNCVPCLDVADPAGHKVIGDRAFASDANMVARLGRAQAQGLGQGGVLPVIKHMPGHGRATVDSHLEMPIVDATREELSKRDFSPFAALADLPLGMTAHVLYPALDPDNPATLSPNIIGEVIRGHIGFEGLLFTDDLSMQALGGDIGQRAAKALAAGCDVALHCNGKADEMQAVAAACRPLSADGQKRWQQARSWCKPAQLADYDDILGQFMTRMDLG
ncbi:MAG: beta-N-acetylhexosaminidase [Alphaproteobacteria bacterium]|jgi:beta-N-acetylhexosaminidase|nr:beta-N-acetylhexosaminidase [Alphaproteobacteria bacterium]